jgi:transcriptional regulator GlxA family with amidase domain
VGVSERHLSRLFVQELDQTPGRYVRLARTEAAAHLLTSTALTIEAVAQRCGYGTAESLRQAFLAAYGISPSHYRLTHASTGISTPTNPESAQPASAATEASA